MKKMHMVCAAALLLAGVSGARATSANIEPDWFGDARPVSPHALFCPFPEQTIDVTSPLPTTMPLAPPTSTTIEAVMPVIRMMINGVPSDIVGPEFPQGTPTTINVVTVPVCDVSHAQL